MDKKLTVKQIDKITKGYQKIIDTDGYMVQVVNPSDNTIGYMYTLGRANNVQFDYIMFGFIKGAFMNEVVNRIAVEGDTIFTSELLLCSLPDGSQVPSRYMVKLVPDEKLEEVKQYAKGCWNKKLVERSPIGFYQIFLSDKNNLLPGEEGYIPFIVEPDFTV